MTYYKRRLPHWLPEGRALFVTWRLHGSLPASQRPRRAGIPACPQATGREACPTRIGEAQPEYPTTAFLAEDRELDEAVTGPLWLEDPRIAQCVVNALRYGERDLHLYDLHAFVIMSNHVHALLRPRAPLAQIMRLLKGYTARQANRILGFTGKRFWQEESYDHWVRDEEEFHRIAAYIERNPVAAGLAKKPEDWPWSSAHKEQKRT